MQRRQRQSQKKESEENWAQTGFCVAAVGPEILESSSADSWKLIQAPTEDTIYNSKKPLAHAFYGQAKAFSQFIEEYPMDQSTQTELEAAAFRIEMVQGSC